MTKYDTVVLGQVVRPEGVISEGAVAIKNGRIVAIGTGREAFDADEVIDCGSSFVLPGGIDAHVHSLVRETEGYANSTIGSSLPWPSLLLWINPLDLGGAPHRRTGSAREKEARGEGSLQSTSGCWPALQLPLIEKIEDCARCGMSRLQDAHA